MTDHDDFKLVPHFCMAIAAPRGSGKSYLTKRILKMEYDYHELIYIICPSLHLNDDYREFKETEAERLRWQNIRFRPHPNSALLREIFDESNRVQSSVQEHNDARSPDDPVQYAPRVLCILDDCIDSNIMRFRGEADRFAERGRHVKMSVIFISQRRTAISSSIRLNVNYFITFAPFAFRDLEKCVEELVPKSMRRVIEERLTAIFEIRYQFLLIDNDETLWYKKFKKSNADALLQGQYAYVFTLQDITNAR